MFLINASWMNKKYPILNENVIAVSLFLSPIKREIEQKGMTLNHDFGYSFPLFSSLIKKRGEKKEHE